MSSYGCHRRTSPAGCMNKPGMAFRRNAKLAIAIWGELSQSALLHLNELIQSYALSVNAGDLQFLDGRWYITHSGLLGIAQRRHCFGIRTTLQKDLSDHSMSHWVFKATVYKSLDSKGFVGYGDADPSNTSPLVRGAEMRVAETRAVNRAPRKADAIALGSVEELGWLTGSPKPSEEHRQPVKPPHQNGSTNGQPKLRVCL